MSSATVRPLVQVRAAPQGESVQLPAVFSAPIRIDVVHFVHTQMAKNKRQPYAVNEMSGMQHSAESWGTGRAVARIPRISGGGTARSGQGAFGNMCRKGRMFAPTKIWRKWHRKISVNMRRFAVVSALAATAVPALVMARGHKVTAVPEIPLVLNDDAVHTVRKTKDAVKLLKSVAAFEDVEKAKESRNLRAGKGKYRNRRYTQRRGPLIVFSGDKKFTRAFRNLPGVEFADVSRLNLLTLAPGGHLGRFVIWTKGAFEKLNDVFGTLKTASKQKHGYRLPRATMNNADLARIINSDEIQSKLNDKAINRNKFWALKRNPLRNVKAMLKLNPYAVTLRKANLKAEAARKAAKESKVAKARANGGLKAGARAKISKARFAALTSDE
nr:60S ribosomal protein L4 [Seculamonas ecuadoriensis]